MKAVIVAAGTGSRLGVVAKNRPKCLLEVSGQSLLQRALAALRAVGVEDVVLVVGYQSKSVAAALAGHSTLRWRLQLNPFYEYTNNMSSLWFARPHVEGDSFLYLHGDLIFHPGILQRLVASPHPTVVAMALGVCDPEAMKVELTPEGDFALSSKTVRPEKCAGEWIGLARFAAADARRLFDCIEEFLLASKFNEYDTAAFSRLAAAGVPIGVVKTDALPYVEIDTPEDLTKAEELFGSS